MAFCNASTIELIIHVIIIVSFLFFFFVSPGEKALIQDLHFIVQYFFFPRCIVYIFMFTKDMITFDE